MHQSRPRGCIAAIGLALALTAPAALAQKAAPASPAPSASFAATAKAKATATAEKVWHGAQDVAIYALGLIGVDYRFGGETPDDGLDCSGLIRYVFQQVTGVTLPRTAKEMARIGDRVVRTDQLQPGDLVFFNTRHFAFSHVGLYLGDDRFIHAPSRGSEVEIARLDDGYWQKHFNGARRLVGVLPSLVPTVIAPAEASSAPVPAPATSPSPEPASPASPAN